EFDPFCTVRNITRDYPPTLLIHGTKDTDVPYALSVQMDKELTAKGVDHKFITIPEGIHGFRSKADTEVAAQTYRQVVEFLEKYRRRSAPRFFVCEWQLARSSKLQAPRSRETSSSKPN